MNVYKSKYTGEQIDSAVEKISTAQTEPLYQNIVYEYSAGTVKRYVGFIYYSKTPLVELNVWGVGNEPPTRVGNTTLYNHLKSSFDGKTTTTGDHEWVPVQVFGIVYDKDGFSDDGYYTTTPAYGRIYFTDAERCRFDYICRMPENTNNLGNQYISYGDYITQTNPVGSFYATSQQIY